MKKTKSWVKILTGISAGFLMGDLIKYVEGNLVIDHKLYIRLGIVLASIAILYIKEFRAHNNFLISVKDSYPYFISIYLVSLGTWVSWGLGFILVFWDFSGDD